MGGLTLLVTGSSGYLGRAVAEEGRARGHRIRCLTRGPGGDICADLAEGLPEGTFDGIDRVIHCAAALIGTEAVMQRDTVLGTRNLARASPVPMVLAGSLAVYDGMAGPLIDETTPLEPQPSRRDAYTRAKIAQEEAAALVPDLRILRIGALWGRGRLWNGHLGPRFGPVLFRLGRGEIPLAHINHAAAALILAAEGGWTGQEVVNVVDDDRPDARRYLAALSTIGQGPRVVLPLPFAAVDLAARALRGSGLLSRPILHARMAPRRYANARLHGLGWRPRHTFVQGIEAAR